MDLTVSMVSANIYAGRVAIRIGISNNTELGTVEVLAATKQNLRFISSVFSFCWVMMYQVSRFSTFIS